jgi:N-ethylmaleimide reductase
MRFDHKSNWSGLDKTSRNGTTQEKEERMAWNGSIDSAARSGGRLLEPVELGRYTLPNRMMMSAMTRNRAGEGDVPTASVVRYYEQRSGAGLIITEGSPISPQGIGYPSTPGVHSDDQVDGWRRVTEAVHGAGGRIFLQLWHVGRISHPSMQEGGALPIAPSAIAPEGEIFTPTGPQPFVTPRALELEEIPGLVDQFRSGAKRALEAGFDGVEIHGATGYILDEFLRDGANHREDEYGGTVENRARLLLKVADAAIEVWGADRVGVKLSPTQLFNSMSDSDPAATLGYVVPRLGERGIAYLHVVEPDPEEGIPEDWLAVTAASFRDRFSGALVGGGGYDRERAEAAIVAGEIDVVAFGQLFLANPDLAVRFAEGAELNVPDPETFYGGGDAGYIDYPELDRIGQPR